MVDAQAVQIVINVTDANSGAVVGGVVQNIQKIGQAGAGTRAQVAAMGQAFTQFGTSGTIAGKVVAQTANEVDKLGNHFQTNLDSVRLFRQELGIHVPRSMETMISRMPMLMGMIQKLSTTMATVGFATIGLALGEELVHGLQAVWNHLNIVNNKLADYRAEVEKTQQQEFGNTFSIETSRQRIDEATTAAENFGKQAQEAEHKTLGWRDSLNLLAPGLGSIVQWWHQLSVAGDLTDQQVNALRERAAADKTESSQYHEQRVKELGLDQAQAQARIAKLPAGAQPRAKAEAEIAAAKANAFEERRFGNEQARMQGNSVAPDAGASAEKLAVETATAKANTELFTAEKAQAEELRKIHEEAMESGLRGSALYHAQEAAAEDDLKRRGLATPQAINDIRTKYHNEEMRRLEDEQRETGRIQGEAALTGLKGIAHTQAATGLEIAGIRGDQNISDQTKDARVMAARQKMNSEILGEEQEFAKQSEALSDEWGTHQVSGFARIRAEAQKAIDARKGAFNEMAGQLDQSDPRRQQAQRNLDQQIGIVNAGAGKQASDLARRNAEETDQIESEARAKLLSAEKQQTAGIEAEYEQRLRKFQDELDAQEISQNDYNRRVLAAEELRDAEMTESARQAREKMAGEFSRFFQNPKGALKEFGDKVAGEMAASLAQRAQGHFGGGATSQSAASPGNFLDNIYGRIAGHRHTPGSGHSTQDFATVKSISLGTAQIHIQSASVLGAGGSTPLSVPAGGFNAPAGSTTPILPGSDLGGLGSESATWLGGKGGGGNTFGLGASGGTASSAPSWTPATLSTGSQGGAGDMGFAPTAAPGFTGGSGTQTQKTSVIGSALGGIQQGVGLLSSAKGIFGSQSSTASQYADVQNPALSGTLKADGTFSSSSGTNNGMLGAGGIMGNLGGAADGAMGLFSAYEGNGGFGGAASGALSGMKLGMALGGPIGAGIGAAAGAVVGAIGFGGREKARVYDLKTVRPRIGNDTDAFDQGSMDYMSAYSDLQSLDQEARKTLDKMGGSARAYYWDTVNGEIKQAEAKLTSQERAGRSQYGDSAAQYDVGTDSVPRTGMAVIHQRERIMPSDQNERITRALENGADSRTMAAQSSGWGGDVHIHAIDAKSANQWIMSNKHQFRAAINASYAENSGGADA